MADSVVQRVVAHTVLVRRVRLGGEEELHDFRPALARREMQRSPAGGGRSHSDQGTSAAESHPTSNTLPKTYLVCISSSQLETVKGIHLWEMCRTAIISYTNGSR